MSKNRLSSIHIIRVIFNAFSLKQKPLTVKEIAEITDIPISTLYKFLKELYSINFVSYMDKKYFIGDKLYTYGEMYIVRNNDLQYIKMIAKKMSDEIGLTTNICTLVQGKQMVLYEFAPNTPFAIHSLMLARNIPITWTASGRLLLKADSVENLWTMLSQTDLMLPNGNSLSVKSFFEEMQEAQKMNFFESHSLINPEYLGLASLVYNNELIQYTLCLTIKDQDISSMKKEAIETLMKYTREIKNNL